MLGGETVPVPKFPHFAVGGAVVGSVADLHLSQGVFGGLAVDEQGEVGLFACPVVISAQRLAIKAIFAAQGGGVITAQFNHYRQLAVLCSVAPVFFGAH